MVKSVRKDSVSKTRAQSSRVGSQRYFASENSVDQLERFKLLVESIQDYAIFLLDTEGHIASWNPGAERFKGYKPDEIIGKHFSVFYGEEDRRNNKPGKELEYSMKHGRVEDEGWRIRKDGSRFWANVVITALYDKEGRHRGFAKVTRDLTERKEYEDRLYYANKRLEISNKDLKALTLAKDEFVSLASHQLRTPATGVKQYLGLLKEGYMGPLSEEQMDCLQKAYESNDRQIEIVNDLLQVAQLDAGKVILKKFPVPIGDMIEDIISEQVDKFKHKKQRIKLNIPQETIVVSADADRLRMVIENLVDNASKYTPDGGKITVTLSLKGKNCLVDIEDTGVGIKKSDLPKLFEKFTRLSNPLTKNVSGSGLGLYWAKKIVELHGGKIAVDSKLHAGTTFCVSIPIGSSHA